jgi:tetratricopeptide (TPR) repeat protein
MKINLLAATLLLSLAATPVTFAAGDAPASEPATEQTPKKLKCKKGEVVKKVDGKPKCVKVTSGILSDDELYMQGRALAKAGEYEWALDVLAAIEDQNQPRVLNYTGYSHRKAGRLETGFAFYKKALAIDPNFVLAREYLGEGYIAAGKVDLAKIQLEEIRVRAGAESKEFIALNKAIVDAEI